jgi:hypothetical protein
VILKGLLSSWVVLISITQLAAQTEKDTIRENIDYRVGQSLHASKPTAERLYMHYAGLQATPFLELVSRTRANNSRNPYNITYIINHRRTGYGIGLGFGYQSNHSKTPKSQTPTIETAEGGTYFRVGFDKKKIFFSHWQMGVGVDLLVSRKKDITKTYSNGFIEETDETTTSYGLGPRATLQYLFGNKIKLGTEICLYFETFNTTIYQKFTGLPAGQDNSQSSAWNFLLPISLFVSARVW